MTVVLSLVVGSRPSLMAVSSAVIPGAPRPLRTIVLFPQSDLLDVNQIVKDLASMVSEQGEAVGGYPRHTRPCSPPSGPLPRGGSAPVVFSAVVAGAGGPEST